MSAAEDWNLVLQFLTAKAEEDPSFGAAVGFVGSLLGRERKGGKLPPNRCREAEDGTLTLEWIWGEDRRVISVSCNAVTDAEFKAGNLSRHSRQHISAESASGR